ncbi:MAG: hypothetical protein HQK89_17440 [Nitrospirae bacterium]|nr:hypothetical protein [Nitrospirota bacterium]
MKNHINKMIMTITTMPMRRRKLCFKVMLLGVASILLYAVLLSNQQAINDYFLRGGTYALLPILTAIIFSLVYGLFAGNFWSLFGIGSIRSKRLRR